MLTITGLFTYPVKSLGGISHDSARLTDRGLQFDRRWMLVDPQGRFLTQRSFPRMALLQPESHPDGFLVYHRQNRDHQFLIPFEPQNSDLMEVEVWEDRCQAMLVGEAADRWFTEQLGMPCRLVFMPDATRREVDPAFAKHHEITSFSDAFPLLLISQESLDDLNSRMDRPVPMNRFRPNIVCSGGRAFGEDDLTNFSISGIPFLAAKPCARCVLTTVDQETAETGRDPLHTLSTYRKKGNKVLFGQNLLYGGTGTIRLGDRLIPL